MLVKGHLRPVVEIVLDSARQLPVAAMRRKHHHAGRMQVKIVDDFRIGDPDDFLPVKTLVVCRTGKPDRLRHDITEMQVEILFYLLEFTIFQLGKRPRKVHRNHLPAIVQHMQQEPAEQVGPFLMDPQRLQGQQTHQAHDDFDSQSFHVDKDTFFHNKSQALLSGTQIQEDHADQQQGQVHRF